MRPSKQSVSVILIVSICAVLLACSQSEQATTRPQSISARELDSGNASVNYTQAVITYVSGEVFVKGTSDWEYLEIGSIVHAQETVKVGENSQCELQFGDNSVVRIQENTEVRLKEFWLEPEQTAIDIDLTLGTVLCKVSKLSAAESFKVRTRAVVCGVRGTEFMVSVVPSHDTVLAVKQGKVAVIPIGTEADKIIEEAGIKNTGIKALLKKMEDSAPVIEADQEVTISEETAAETARLVNAMADELKKVEKEEKVTAAELKKADTLIIKTTEKIQKVIHHPRETTENTKEKLKSFDRIELKKIRVVPDTASKAKPKAEDEKAAPLLKEEQEKSAVIEELETVTAPPEPDKDKQKSAAETKTEEKPTEEKVFKVLAAKSWQDTGIIITKGNHVVIKYVSGKWALSGAAAQVDGRGHSGNKLGPENFDAGSLLGRIGDIGPFEVGNYFEIDHAERTGTLYLRMNELDGRLTDNIGSLRIKIMIEK